MNKLPVYLYPNVLDVILDLDQNIGIHKTMYQRKIRIQKGFKDSVQLQFKNSDQKLISISTGTYQFDLIDVNHRQLLFTKQVDVLETTSINTLTNVTTYVNKGIGLVTFDPIDTISLVPGDYKFVVKHVNADGTYTPAYSNTYYGITGDIELVEDGFPIGYPIQTVNIAELESGKDYDRTFGDMGFVFTTGWLRPVIRPTTTATETTAVITLAGFKGRIFVEGTLDTNPSGAHHANAQAFNIVTWSTNTQTTSMVEIPCGSGYTAVRFKIKPDNNAMGTNYYPTGFPIGSQTNKFPNGFVDQIQYRS